MSALVIALAVGQSYPYLITTASPGLTPGTNSSNTSQPLILPTIIPGTTPAVITPANIPQVFGANAAAILGSCTALCTGNSTSPSIQLYCIRACGSSARQAALLPVAVCTGVTTQAQCNTCFYAVLCQNIFGLSSSLLSALSGTCFCVPTLNVGCPSCSSSKKGLLGLLGLLGLIPLLLLLLLCLLCCLRRRKRQQDVHFATFDPAAANLAVPMPCPGVPPPPY